MAPYSGGLLSWFLSDSPLLLGIGITAEVALPKGMFLEFLSSGSLTDSVLITNSTIRLPGDARSAPAYGGDTGVISTLASVPWFIVGIVGIGFEWVSSNVGSLSRNFRTRRGYRNLPVDEDAQILRFEDED